MSEKHRKPSSSSPKQGHYIWRSPLLQAIGTMRAGGQIYCASELQKLWTILHEYNPKERSEVKIVQQLMQKLETTKPTSR